MKEKEKVKEQEKVKEKEKKKKKHSKQFQRNDLQIKKTQTNQKPIFWK